MHTFKYLLFVIQTLTYLGLTARWGVRHKPNFIFFCKGNSCSTTSYGVTLPPPLICHLSISQRSVYMHGLLSRVLISLHCSECLPLHHIQHRLYNKAYYLVSLLNLFTVRSIQLSQSFANPQTFKYLLITFNKTSVGISAWNGIESIDNLGGDLTLLQPSVFMNKDSSSFVST